VVAAPAEVKAEPEARATPVEIILTRKAPS
jgi:hypothetical protein